MTINNYLTSLVKKTKILGRGIGSGRGKTAGRGTKGQGSRKSPGVRPGFEGGQTPVFRRVPKRGGGFKNRKSPNFKLVNLFELNNNPNLSSGAEINFTGKRVKILGQGDLDKKLVIKAAGFSASAVEKIEKLGGKCQIVDDFKLNNKK